jgi:hypothetical protein
LRVAHRASTALDEAVAHRASNDAFVLRTTGIVCELQFDQMLANVRAALGRRLTASTAANDKRECAECNATFPLHTAPADRALDSSSVHAHHNNSNRRASIATRRARSKELWVRIVIDRGSRLKRQLPTVREKFLRQRSAK